MKNPTRTLSSARNIDIKIYNEKSAEIIIKEKPNLNLNVSNIFVDEII
jgi:hypothetical protein